MIRRRDVKESAETGYLELYNTSSVLTIPKGGAVVWDYITGGFNGWGVMQPTSGTLAFFCGLADEDILPASFGRVQVRGFQPVALVINETVTDLAVGELLVPVANQFYLARSAGGSASPSLAVSAEAYVHATVPTVATKKVHLPFR